MCRTCATFEGGSARAAFLLFYFLTEMPEMTQVLETITPDRAKEYLRQNVGNRPIKMMKLNALMSDLRKGQFRLTHQGIAFDHHGVLIDGQHRLKAIAETGVAAPMYVTRNCDPESFRVIDCGATRSPQDVLKHVGSKNYAAVATAIRVILWMKSKLGTYRSTTLKNYKTHIVLSNTDIAEFYMQHEIVLDKCSTVCTSFGARNCLLLQSASIAFLFLLHEHGAELMESGLEFLRKVDKGANLEQGSVELALSKFLSLRYIDMQGYTKGQFMLVVYIKAFNKYMRGDVLVNFRPGNIEPVPTIELP